MTQRCFFTAERKLGFVSRVSLRALIIRAPILGSLDHGGTRPQWASRSWRVISPLDLSMRSKITRMSRVGAIFHEGVTSRASGTWNSTANWETRSGVGVTAAKRPHMAGLQLSGRFKRQIRIGEFGGQIIGPGLDDLNAHLAEHAAHCDAL